MGLAHMVPNGGPQKPVRPNALRVVVVWFAFLGLLGLLALAVNRERFSALPWYVWAPSAMGILALGLFMGWRWAWVVTLVLSFVMIPLGIWGTFFRQFTWHRLFILLQWIVVPYVLMHRDVRHFFFGWIRDLRQQQDPLVRKKERLMTFCGWFFALVAGVTVWQWWINIDPKIDIVAPPQPDPNGYDVLVSAGRSVVVPDNLKGFLALLSAKSVSVKGLKNESLAVRSGREQLVSVNAAALRLLQKGLGLPCRFRPLETVNGKYPYRDDLLRLARLLRTKGQVLAARGEWSQAVESDLQLFELGFNLQQGPGLIGWLVALKCKSAAVADMRASTRHLCSREARTAAGKLSVLIEKGESIAAACFARLSRRAWTLPTATLSTHPRLPQAIAHRPFLISGEASAISIRTHEDGLLVLQCRTGRE